MKRTFKMALIASLAVGGSYVLYGSQNKEELSDLALSNVEALTLGTKDCMYQRNSRCYELVVGPPGEPVIIETSMGHRTKRILRIERKEYQTY